VLLEHALFAPKLSHLLVAKLEKALLLFLALFFVRLDLCFKFPKTLTETGQKVPRVGSFVQCA
jgi:hypothetical protein